MYLRIPITEYKDINPRAFILSCDTFECCKYIQKKKSDPSHNKIMDALCEGKFCALITDLEYGKLKNRAGKENVHNFFNSKIKTNPRVTCVQIRVAGFLDKFSEMSEYDKLFRLVKDRNLHEVDLATIITGIELNKPIVSNDPHIWRQQNNIIRTYRERHKDERVNDIKNGRKTKDITIFTTKDFCKQVLPRIETF